MTLIAHFVRPVALIAAVLSLGGCVAPFPPVPQAENADRIERMLVEAYEDAGGAYDGEVSISEMALAGLANLTVVEPGLSLLQSGDSVTLNLYGEPFYSFDKPAEAAADDWAEAISEALVAVHQRSQPIQSTPPQEIFDSYMAGLAGALGDDSRYFPSEEFYGYLYANIDGLIDLTYAQTDDGLRVLSLDREGRLTAAGLATDDIITHIDGKATAGLSQFEVYSLLRGQVESNIHFNILRDGEALPSSVAVQRWKIVPRSYQLTRGSGITIYRVPILNEFAANELARSLGTEVKRAQAEKHPLTGVVLDLRGEPPISPTVVSNPSVTLGTSRPDWSGIVGYIDTGFMSGPGGSPGAARLLATAFMSHGVVLRQQGKQDKANFSVEAGGTNPSGQLPLVVLVDSSTIGGAEMAAAALQDTGRALVVGGGTAGFGTIRRNVSLYNLGVINLPWAKAYAPSGYGIEGRGVLPQICTSMPGATLDGLLTGLRRGQGMTDAADRTRPIDPKDEAALATQRVLCPSVRDEDDLTLDLALAILKDPGLYARLMAGSGS